MTKATLRDVVLSAAMGALALALPAAFHVVGLGNRFLPLLQPLLILGLLASPGWAIATGALMPLVSALAVGMPPLYPPVAAVLSVEGAVLAGVASLIHRNGKGAFWPALIGGVIASRAAGFLCSYALARAFGLPAAFASAATLVQGLPGVALMLVAAPPVIYWTRRRGGPLFGDQQ
jgi:hypothetical protein